ncbi:MAG TPA: Ig-like domain-containing protein, partial [Thermoanaerobaculia bacterium]|nr:Ig-like domain-containing protein [Thermoanaerobaculia bacterium]
MLTFKAAKAGLFVFFCLPFSLFAATRNWTGTTNGNWSVAANWGGTAPSAGDDLVFDNATNANALNNDYPAGTAFHSLTFNAPGTFSPDGNSILLGTGGITVTAGTTLNDFIPVTLAVSQTWNANGPLVLNGPANLTLGSNTLTMTGSGSHLFSGNTISGTGGITLGGSLTLQFSGHMNYIGPTIAGGTAHLVLGTPNNVNTPITINSGAFLDDSLGFPAFLLAPLTINSGGTYEVIINGAGFGNFTSMTANDAPVTLGGNLALTNTVSNPAGTVFTIIRNQTGSAVAGTFAGLPEGATIVSGGQSFVISYVGGSGKDVTLTAQAPPTSTTTSVVGAPNPSALNQNVQFTVNVTPNAAVGSVALNDGATNLNNGVLSGGSVVFDISSLSVGSHNITAVYGGGAGFMGSTSPIFVQVVSAPLIATNTSLNSTLNPSTVGQSVTFTATVAPAATGNVSFFDGATPLGTIALNGSSQAAVSTSALTLGSHNITATYNGDATHSA